MAALQMKMTTLSGNRLAVQPAAARPMAARTVIVRAELEGTSRRQALGLVATAAGLLARPSASLAAYGDAANIFGKPTNTTGFVPYAGEGYALLLPATWNPSKEREFPGIKVRYEDNGDSVNSLLVIVKPTDKKSIEDFGTPDKFLADNGYLLGEQTFTGETRSEGGFKPNKVSAASLLGVESATDKKGKSYYKYNILTRTADGDEGGRHQLLAASVSGGNLYILKVQIGDKRWFKGVDKAALGVWNSFVVA
jgi:hypothetical protein